ncbi:eosinophil peroxidase-like [Clinocottus analis]|uniref:eosinophil peroxidase-like n=1 Tax=Clinocottus analis TaxID=304258 RepID=UPI0035C24B72
MNIFLYMYLLPAVLYLSLQCQVDAESHLSRKVIERAVIEAKATVDSAYEHSRTVSIERVKRNAASQSDILQLVKQPVGQTRNAVRAADYMDNAVKLIKRSLERRQKRSINATDLISEDDLQVIADLTGCSPRRRPLSCRTLSNLDKFRTASGICNNRFNTRWGSSNIPFTRWLPAEYQDAISLPKGWDPDRKINNQLLPLVREVSNNILRSTNSDVKSDPLFTQMVTMFGQWIDHDMSFTPHSPVIRSFNNGIDCDQSCARTEPCFPVQIPKKDPRFGKNSRNCIPFFRSAAACGSGNTGHVFGASTVRQQMNALTAFLDVGQVYGSDDTKARFLRDLTSDKGLMRVNTQYTDNGRELLPFSTMVTNMCATRALITNDKKAKEVPCFVAGDERTNEHIVLTSLHTLFLREHNRLARALAALNPHWNGERLYQEARKIMGGHLQVLTFRDFLLLIVGPDIASHLSTYPAYDGNVDPSIANVFATAAYRFGHLTIQPFTFRLNEQYQDHPDFPSPMLHKTFFTPWRVVFEGGLDPILRGLVGRHTKLNSQDSMMTDEIRERLFKFTNEVALDLAAFNMQRGRDHGLPGYNQWRKFCGLSQPQNQAELAIVLRNKALAKKLLDLYRTPDNIDAWMGGLSEPFVRGGRTGPLFACLITTQFQRTRMGDRFWWENTGVFTEDQRNSLRQTSLARIICDNTGITEVPEKPFLYRPRGSGYTQCKKINAFDLSPWKEGGQVSRGPSGPPGPAAPPVPPGPPQPLGSMAEVTFYVLIGNYFPKSGKPIYFHEVVYNIQKSYDTVTGFFTCPRAGVYDFQFHCTVHKNEASMNLMCNNDLVLPSFNTRHSGYITASGNTHIKLNTGDHVYLMASQEGYGMTVCVFSGHLVFTE